MIDKTKRPAIIREGFYVMILAAASACLSVGVIFIWNDAHTKRDHLESGGPAFAANLEPMLISLSGIVLGLAAGVGIPISLWLSDKPAKRAFTAYHGVSILLLVPAVLMLVLKIVS